MLNGDQVEGMGIYTIQPEETPIGSDEGVSALGLAVAEKSGDGGGADRGHLGRRKLENLKKSETLKKGEATAWPFILSKGLSLVPVKLATSILRGDFVDMAELLHDNLEVQGAAPCRNKQAPLHPLQLT